MIRLLVLFLVGCAIGTLFGSEAIPGATAAQWAADPEAAAKAAGTVAAKTSEYGVGFWVAAGTILLTILGAAKKYAPLISRFVPVWGPMIEGAANILWSVASTKDQKEADATLALAQKAASTHLVPILTMVQALPAGTLPDHIQQYLNSPIVRAALDQLAIADRNPK